MHTLEKLRSSDFIPYLNQIFCIRLEGTGSIELELVRVTEAGVPSRVLNFIIALQGIYRPRP